MSFNPTYGITRNLGAVDFDAAVAATRTALSGQGFGVLTEINVQATMKKKIDKDMEEYLILGACSPHHAWRAISAEAPIGLLLPCNVIVVRQDGDVIVSAVEPSAMFKVVEREDVAPLAKEVGDLLSAAVAAISLD